MVKIGRNDPCPCASGKKHKKCCGGGFRPTITAAGGGVAAVSVDRRSMERPMAEIGRMLMEQEFGSSDEMYAYLGKTINDSNRAPASATHPARAGAGADFRSSGGYGRTARETGARGLGRFAGLRRCSRVTG
jgi:hypothetical protein